jgi:succinate-semialdehyde dehydrogenase/glutarate-semialdehyde dehydrogenase
MQETPGMYPKVQMFIAGEWTDGSSGKSEDILNPATGQPIGKTPHASRKDLDRALEAAKAGFETWRRTSSARARPRSRPS